ncbi:hypothetical protein [Kitasatospora sp. NPDC017646]|uniref:hypothetical protein n=1 Tax=Kitasatospora sp. NPDC017646 TaxID=3364024 RepID=UPI0037B40BB7
MIPLTTDEADEIAAEALAWAEATAAEARAWADEMLPPTPAAPEASAEAADAAALAAFCTSPAAEVAVAPALLPEEQPARTAEPSTAAARTPAAARW